MSSVKNKQLLILRQCRRNQIKKQVRVCMEEMAKELGGRDDKLRLQDEKIAKLDEALSEQKTSMDDAFTRHEKLKGEYSALEKEKETNETQRKKTEAELGTLQE